MLQVLELATGYNQKEVKMFLPVQVILPISIFMGLISYFTIAKWYILPRIEKWSIDDQLAVLLVPHFFRFIGFAFLIHGVTTDALDPRFSIPAAFGDIIAAILALLTFYSIKLQFKYRIIFAFAFNCIGFFDFVNAMTRGLLFVEPKNMGATYFIPMVIVPMLMMSHILIFRFLLQSYSSRKKLT